MSKWPKIDKSERVVAIAFILALVLMCGIVAFFSYQIKDLKAVITTISFDKPNNGKDGKNGLDGVNTTIIQTLPGEPGKDGANVTQDQVDQAVHDYFTVNPVKNGTNGDKGDKGEQGEPGTAGRTMIQRTNSSTGETECKYQGDMNWMSGDECL